MAILSAVLVSESLSATLMMPFVGLFVSHLQHVPPSEAGYMSGLLISVFQLGQVLTGKMWGTASDRVGRKPMIQVGLLANAIVSTFFGMSPNLTFCIIMRFIHGCANGNVLVAKTVIADITDKETEGMGFAAISIFWGIGSIVGPAIGGYLYDPVHHAVLGPRLFPGVTEESGNIFLDHPALLPCLVIGVFSVITLFIISWILPETSRHPVDPLLSLFTGHSCVRDHPTPHAKRLSHPTTGGPISSGASHPATAGELIAVVEAVNDNDAASDDDVDSQYDDADILSGSDGWKAASSPAAPSQLTKRLFSSTNALLVPEGLNKVIASAMLAKEYDRRAAVPGTTAHVVTGRHATQHTPRSSSVGGRREPRRRKNDDEKLHDDDNPWQGGSDKRTGTGVITAGNNGVDNGLHSRNADDAKLANSLLKREASDSFSDDAVSAPMAFGYREAFRMPSSRNVMVMYMCIASTESALLEIIPLWAISEREKGGLGFASADIGTLLCISSVVYVAVNVVFSRVLKCLGGATRPLWDFSVLLWCVTSILTPCCAYFTNEQSIFYSASLITSVREIGLSWSYSILYMYVVRCAPDDCAGSINGIAQSIGSFSRMLTMLFIPPVFAWSLNGVTHPFPLNFHFVFWVTCVPLLLSFVMSSYLPVRVTG
jgi:MFS family permease